MSESKDLTEALRQLTEQAPPAPSPPPPRGAVSRTVSAAVPAGAAPSSKGSAFTLGGEKTLASTDGLFSFVFPETLVTTFGDAELTVGCIKKVTSS